MRDRFARIKHGQSVRLPKLYLRFPSLEEASSFDCHYELRVQIYRTQSPGNWQFVINTGHDTANNRASCPSVLSDALKGAIFVTISLPTIAFGARYPLSHDLPFQGDNDGSPDTG